MLAVVLTSVLMQHLVTVCEAQKTVDDNICDLCREDIDQLFACRENLAASNRKDGQFEDSCTLTETRKVCFQIDNLIPLGREKPSEFNDIDQFPPKDIEKVFVTGITMHIGSWGVHTVIRAIEVTYNASSAIFQHGSQCSQTNGTERFRLDPGDRITSISAKSGMMIDQLTFTTKNGRTYGPYGGNGGSAVGLSPRKPNGYLAYVAGLVISRDDCKIVNYLNFVWGYA